MTDFCRRPHKSRQDAAPYSWPMRTKQGLYLAHPPGAGGAVAGKRAQARRAPPSGGRRYWLDIAGRLGWRARYVKQVDTQENTVRFWQEIYDGQGKLVETHEKYPVDKGHQKQ
jgi:hypothetical protein